MLSILSIGNEETIFKPTIQGAFLVLIRIAQFIDRNPVWNEPESRVLESRIVGENFLRFPFPNAWTIDSAQ